MVRHDLDEAFRFDLAERFADGDAADLKFVGQSVLAQLFALLNFAANNHFPQFVGDGGGEGLARNPTSTRGMEGSKFRFAFYQHGTNPKCASDYNSCLPRIKHNIFCPWTWSAQGSAEGRTTALLDSGPENGSIAAKFGDLRIEGEALPWLEGTCRSANPVH